MAGGVHLDHVDMAAFGDGAARLADAAGGDGRATVPIRTDTVQRLGNQPRGRGLADPAHAGHQERMGQAVALDRVAQRLDHRVLPDQGVEGLRPVFARKDAIRLGLGRRLHRLGRFAQVERISHDGSGWSGCWKASPANIGARARAVRYNREAIRAPSPGWAGTKALMPLKMCGGWEPERPAAKSLRLLPSGPDRVGDDYVRPTPDRAYGEAGPGDQVLIPPTPSRDERSYQR